MMTKRQSVLGERIRMATNARLISLVVAFAATRLVAGDVERAEILRLVSEKKYPTFTQSPADRSLALELLTQLGCHRDSVGNIYLSPSFTDADMPILFAFRDAPGILMYPSQVTDDGLAYVRELTSVRVLNPLPEQVTDAGITHLRGLPLEGLKLPPKCTDQCMQTVATLKLLRGIELSQHISDTGFAHISQLPELTGLKLNNCEPSFIA